MVGERRRAPKPHGAGIEKIGVFLSFRLTTNGFFLHQIILTLPASLRSGATRADVHTPHLRSPSLPTLLRRRSSTSPGGPRDGEEGGVGTSLSHSRLPSGWIFVSTAASSSCGGGPLGAWIRGSRARIRCPCVRICHLRARLPRCMRWWPPRGIVPHAPAAARQSGQQPGQRHSTKGLLLWPDPRLW